MKKNSPASSISAGKKGDAVILTVMILLVLFIFTASMLFVFTAWQKSAFKAFSGKNAYRLAKGAIEEAIWEIDHDDPREDSFLDPWRANFTGSDADLDEDGIPDSRWFETKNRQGETTGRYALLVEDESGKININHAGGSGSEASYSVSDISILPWLLGETARENIVEYRKTREYEAPSEIKLVKNIGESTYERIRNYITCFSYDLNRDRDGNERLNLNTSSFGDLRKLLLEEEFADDVATQTALNIISFRERGNVPATSGDMTGIDKTPYINEVDSVRPWHVETLQSGAIIYREEGGQFIELFNPYEKPLDIGGWKIKGVVTLFSDSWKEVLDDSGRILSDVSRGETGIDPSMGKRILENLVPTSIVIPRGEKIPARSFYTIGDRISLKIVVLPGEPLTVIPLLVPIKDPGGCDLYRPILAVNPGSIAFLSGIIQHIPFLTGLGLDFKLRVLDSHGNTVEITEYPPDPPDSTVQKNDPRMNGISNWFPGTATPNGTNGTFFPQAGGEFDARDWMPNWPSHFNVGNSPFLSIAGLSLIHRKEQWKTIDFWKGGRDRRLLDRVTTFPQPGLPTHGRLNINTSTETVLACLPMVDNVTAGAIMAARPYGDISEVLGRHGTGNTPAEELNRTITRYGFDLSDNDSDGFIDTDMEKEAVFSRIANLITVRSNVFKIMAIGQKVREVRKNGKIEKEILAEKKVTVWYDRKKRKIIYRREVE